MRRGRFVLVLGVSGAGKNTVMQSAMAELSKRWLTVESVVSTTTREPRPGEHNGIDYNFVTAEVFKEKQAGGGFAESAEVHGKLYGTDANEVIKRLDRSDLVFHDIDIQGAVQILRRFPDALSVCIAIDPEKISERLNNRGESDAEITKRIVTAQVELSEFARFPFDILIDNNKNDGGASATHTLVEWLIQRLN